MSAAPPGTLSAGNLVDGERAARHRTLLIATLCIPSFLVALDFSMVSIALPTIQRGLAFSTSDLQWVATAYALTFGGSLLLGGRASDLYGRRRVLTLGLALFAVGSMAAGVAFTGDFLLGARATQGLGAALAVPSALSVITTLFPQGIELNRVLGLAGAAISVGLIGGVLFSGILTPVVGWRAVMFASAVIAAPACVMTNFVLRDDSRQSTLLNLDLPGAISITGALFTLLYVCAQGNTAGWHSAQTAIGIVAATSLLTLFLVRESHFSKPLLPLSLLTKQSVAFGGTVTMLNGAAGHGAIFMLTLYTQQVLGFTPLGSGLVISMFGVGMAAGGQLAARLASCWEIRDTLSVGLVLQAAGIGALVGNTIVGNTTLMVGGAILIGTGHIMVFVMCTSLVTTGLGHHRHGVATGMLNTALESGSGLGVALLVAIAVGRADAETGRTVVGGAASTLTEGFQQAFLAGGVVLLFAALAVFATRFSSMRKTAGTSEPPLACQPSTIESVARPIGTRDARKETGSR